MGTPEFACSSLLALTEKNHEVISVVTQPDRPKGRGRTLSPSPVKEVALSLGLSLLQPEDPKAESFIEELRRFAPELIVVVAYGHILKKEILEIPSRGCINLHPSLLPKLRGAAPIPWAIIRGEKETGVTTFFMNERMDAGEIILQKITPIGEEEDAGGLSARLAKMGAELLAETVDLIEKGRAPRTVQDESQVTYAPKLKKEDSILDWKKGARDLVNLIRGLSPEPGAYTLFRGEPLKILKGKVETVFSSSFTPGVIIKVERNGIYLQTGDGFLVLKEVQPSGKRILQIGDFINGYRPQIGEKMGDTFIKVEE